MVGSQRKAGRASSISPIALALSALVAAGILVVAGRPARSDPPPATDKGAELSDELSAGQIRVFKNFNSLLCMGVEDASTKPFAYIKQFTCDGGAPNQKWEVGPLREANFRTIKNHKSGLCVGVDHASTERGADIRQFPCDGSDNQRWRLDKPAPSIKDVFFTNYKSTLLITVTSKVNGTQIKQQPVDNNARHQLWLY